MILLASRTLLSTLAVSYITSQCSKQTQHVNNAFKLHGCSLPQQMYWNLTLLALL